MVLTTVNPAQRLLYLAYIGRVTFQEMTQARERLGPLLEQLPARVRLIADLERLDEMDAASASEIGKVMDMLDRKGIEISVRVIPDPSKDIGLNILGMFHYRTKVKVVTRDTMTEAAKELGI